MTPWGQSGWNPGHCKNVRSLFDSRRANKFGHRFNGRDKKGFLVVSPQTCFTVVVCEARKAGAHIQVNILGAVAVQTRVTLALIYVWGEKKQIGIAHLWLIGFKSSSSSSGVGQRPGLSVLLCFSGRRLISYPSRSDFRCILGCNCKYTRLSRLHMWPNSDRATTHIRQHL